MKQLINLKFLGALSLISVLMTSCLKDKGYEDGEYGLGEIEGKELITIPFAKNAENAVALELKDEMQVVELFSANYDFASPAPQDITVTLEKNDALIPAGFLQLPANVYTIQTYDLVIPKGQRLSSVLKMNINTGTLDPNEAYAIGFSIKSVSKNGVTIASNLRDVLFTLSLKNKYDGEYTVNGPLVDALNASITQWPNWKAYLVTTGPTSCVVIDMSYTGFEAHPIKSGGASSYYGSFGMEFHFDPATDKVIDVTSPYAPAANTRDAEIDPSGLNFWDPATRNIKVKYFMMQPSLIAGPRVTFDETFTYVGPRP